MGNSEEEIGRQEKARKELNDETLRNEYYAGLLAKAKNKQATARRGTAALFAVFGIGLALVLIGSALAVLGLADGGGQTALFVPGAILVVAAGVLTAAHVQTTYFDGTTPEDVVIDAQKMYDLSITGIDPKPYEDRKINKIRGY